LINQGPISSSHSSPLLQNFENNFNTRQEDTTGKYKGSYQKTPEKNYDSPSSAQIPSDYCGDIPTTNNWSSPSDFNNISVASSSSTQQTLEDMPCRERTSEFRTAAKSLEMKQHAMNGYTGKRPHRKAVEDSVAFNQKAKRIGRDLSHTCAKLEKLAMLTKKTTLFNDRVSEIEELTDLVKMDITGLNKQIGHLQEFVNSRHLGESGTAQTRQGRPQTGQHSRSVVVGLQSRLAAMSNEFKDVLEERTERLRSQKTRRDKFSMAQPVPSSLPRSVSSGQMGSVLLSDEARANGAVSLDMDAMERDRLQHQVMLIDEQDSYVQARANAMENIESSVVELGTIFKQLADLVQEQGETVQRIDSNVEETSMNVEAAHMELLKYFRSISKNRWLAIKVFGVLVVFFVIFIIFMT
jgi:syntaxin 5